MPQALHETLIITYLFPPSGGVGAPRYAAYARYLPEHGCGVSVLTARFPTTPLHDPELLRVIPGATRVFRVFNPDVPYAFRDRIWKRLIGAASNGTGSGPSQQRGLARRWAREVIARTFNPDVQRFWVPFVMRAARRIIAKMGIQSVILNTPPYSLYSIVEPLKQEFPDVKWITEIRDDWLGFYLEQFDTAVTDSKRRLAIELERRALLASDYVVTVTPAWRDALIRRYPTRSDRIVSVTNGYDGDLYAGFRPTRAGRRNVVITYFGSLYASAPYDIRPYLDAVESLPPSIRDQIETRFIGRVSLDARPLLARPHINVRTFGFLPVADGVRKLAESDYCLLVEHEASAISAKLFDYLPTGLPIIAVSPPHGEVARILAETGTGRSADGRDPSAIRKLLIDAVERLHGATDRFPEPHHTAIQSYERRQLVEDFVRLTKLGETAADPFSVAGRL